MNPFLRAHFEKTKKSKNYKILNNPAFIFSLFYFRDSRFIASHDASFGLLETKNDSKIWSFFTARYIDIIKIHQRLNKSKMAFPKTIGFPLKQNFIFSLPNLKTGYSTGRIISFSVLQN